MTQSGNYNFRVEWHAPDEVFVAVFVRDSEPFYLNGALVGHGPTPAAAVEGLLRAADYLVVHGENFFTEGQISTEDRQWLFMVMDMGNDDDVIQARYLAMRAAHLLPQGY